MATRGTNITRCGRDYTNALQRLGLRVKAPVLIRPSIKSYGGYDGFNPTSHPVHGGRIGGCIDRLIMKCISWNVWGLHDERRRGIVGWYLRDWGADVICLQETMLTHLEQQLWTSLRWGSGESQVSMLPQAVRAA